MWYLSDLPSLKVRSASGMCWSLSMRWPLPAAANSKLQGTHPLALKQEAQLERSALKQIWWKLGGPKLIKINA